MMYCHEHFCTLRLSNTSSNFSMAFKEALSNTLPMSTQTMAMSTFNAVLKSRGLAFIDDGLASRRAGPVPRASADRVIDDELSASAIDAQLRALEGGAAGRGQSLGSGFAYPVTINQVRIWAAGLQARGLQLAPQLLALLVQQLVVLLRAQQLLGLIQQLLVRC